MGYMKISLILMIFALFLTPLFAGDLAPESSYTDENGITYREYILRVGDYFYNNHCKMTLVSMNMPQALSLHTATFLVTNGNKAAYVTMKQGQPTGMSNVEKGLECDGEFVLIANLYYIPPEKAKAENVLSCTRKFCQFNMKEKEDKVKSLVDKYAFIYKKS